MSTPIILGPYKDRPHNIAKVAMPQAALQALFDLLSHLETGEFERKMRLWTEMGDEEIATAGQWLDQLYDYLYQQGMRPRKFKRGHLPLIRRATGSVLLPPGVTREGW